MRRSRAKAGQLAMVRKGVTVNTTHSMRSVQSPVARTRASAGLAPRRSANAAKTNQHRGSAANKNAPGLAARWASQAFTEAIESVELLEVHAGVQLPHLGLVAVEHQCLALLGKQAVFADAALGGLTPARVVHIGVHIGIEAILVGSRFVPGGTRLLLGEADLDDALAALETVLPRHHQTHGRTVLLGQHFAIHAKTQQRQREIGRASC